VWFVDSALVVNAISYEKDPERAALAKVTSAMLQAKGIHVQTLDGNLFDFVRKRDQPHIFFIDIQGICTGEFYDRQFGEMFRSQRIREDDAIFITSYLGRNPGWERLSEIFDSEFRVLGLADEASRRKCYRRAHPSFTLYRGLSLLDLQNELELQCFGCLEYRDTSPMGVYGYRVAGGKTDFTRLVSTTPYYNTITRETEDLSPRQAAAAISLGMRRVSGRGNRGRHPQRQGSSTSLAG
jgi:hypothetical protein